MQITTTRKDQEDVANDRGEKANIRIIGAKALTAFILLSFKNATVKTRRPDTQSLLIQGGGFDSLI